MNNPIRILHVVTYMGRGGLETMLMNYYRHIDRKRVQFDFLTHRYFKADYDDEILSLGGMIYHLPRLVPWSPSYRKALNQFLSEHPEYRIIHVHQDCLSSIILKIAKKNNIPVRIAHAHSSSQDKNLKYPIKLWYKRNISKYATKLFACGDKAGQWMFGGAPYQVVNNAIDANNFTYNPIIREKMRKQLGLLDEVVVGHVGRFSQAKNHSFLLEIFAAFLLKRPKAVLLLVGQGESMAKIQSKVFEIGIAEKVRFLGSRNDVADLMQAMDVFAFPSLYEGLGMVTIEAQAAGLPCVVSEQVPPEAIVTDGLVGRCSLSTKPEVWAEKLLEKCVTSRTDRRAEIVAHGFDITKEAMKLQEFYLQAYEQSY